MFCVPKINKNNHETDTMSIKDKNLGIKPVSVDKSNARESLPEKVIEKKLVLSEKVNINKSINIKKGVKNKIKRQRDPAAPKKPRSSFLLWSMDERAKLKGSEEFSKLSFSDVTKELGKRWNALNPEAKEMYEERYRTEKIEYKQNMENYKPSEEFQNLPSKSIGNVKKIKDKNAPKKPTTAFFRWSSVQREEIKDELAHLSVTEKSKELGRRWGVLPAAHKQIYQDKYDQEKIEYDTKMLEYKPSVEFLRLKEENDLLRFREENKIKWKSGKAETESEQNVMDKVEPYFKFSFNTWHKAIEKVAKNHPDVSKIGPLEIEQCLHEMWEDKIQKGNNRNKAKLQASKDSNAPKKPLNARQIFGEILIPGIKEENPLLSTTDIRSVVNDNWQGLTELDRAEFIQQEAVEKERYREEMEKYQKIIDKL